MQAIFKRSLSFTVPGGKAPKTHIAANSPDPQSAPDWIRGTTEFKLAMDDGLIIETSGGVPKASKPQK